ncbi:adenylyltransferase/cytidyltransferase family protein [Candidatus Woesearchaeota archaeon]|jgi:rfaE bifunctional protein nucleotidyltransferase chain/domain|nr:adenylyltransferase/cytidyltransferase family protein [Candidatus Woesearchaeota archaeon]MBT4367943.1 adenylyltransferase/cytidyltransferase family protein [Candidatus Woesearchaeota archaeon]MBT4712431.1 adenylyltransferase/cytidyltransferase family protein [Candidatus Woesearchaeota archaeon]MBT6639343.1 adenylyltransferase/cytidyltransferase family protein [Candidatus Woesearchaeota archaeon]MBT7133516.1 adenylyltransferase/cytidyltransferase family protein [Candidatus Woesearchaeota arc
MTKIYSQQELAEVIAKLKQEGKKVVTTNGTFDILHLAHVKILEKANELGDVLVVLVNSDSSVRENKGPNRPIVPQEERMQMLASLECVDYVTWFDEQEVVEPLARLKPSIHAKGGTYIQERVAKEQEVMKENKGEWINFEVVEGYSTTNVIEKVLDVYKK